MLVDDLRKDLATLLDNTSTARQDYEILLTHVQRLRDEYRRRYEKADALYNLMLGNRGIEL